MPYTIIDRTEGTREALSPDLTLTPPAAGDLPLPAELRFQSGLGKSTSGGTNLPHRHVLGTR